LTFSVNIWQGTKRMAMERMQLECPTDIR
jgi:hypothetical protein